MFNPDVIISLLLVLGVAIAVIIGKRDGQANPVNTRKLQSDLAKLTGQVTESNGKFNALEASVQELRDDMGRQPTKSDIVRLEERIANTAKKADLTRIEEKVNGVAGHVENVDASVVRIEQLLMGNSPVAQIAAGVTSRRRK